MSFYYSQILNCDIANGIGWRVSLFVSGCSLHCKGCFNQDAWNYKFGKEFTKDTEQKILELLSPNYIKGLSLLGGNPTDPLIEKDLVSFIKVVKEFYPNKDIWLWSGETFEDLVKRNDPLMELCDVLIDGPFIEEQRDLTLAWRGSHNQRVIDLKQSLKSNSIIEIT